MNRSTSASCNPAMLATIFLYRLFSEAPAGESSKRFEGALAGQRHAFVLAITSVTTGDVSSSGQQCEQRIMAELFVIVEIFVAQRDPHHTLREQIKRPRTPPALSHDNR